MDKKYSYTIHGEDSEHWYGGYLNRDEAIEEARAHCIDTDQKEIWICEALKPETPKISAERLLEDLREQANEEGPENCCFLECVSTELQQELETKLNEVYLGWLKRYGYEPDWWVCGSIERVEI